jgi:plasmid stabilization system protein ParE
MIYKYRLHPAAVDDYSEAYAWYEDRKTGLGERFISAVRIRLDEISLHPESYSSKKRKDYREAKLDFFPYLIVYRINKRSKEILIASIHHTSRNTRKKYRK